MATQHIETLIGGAGQAGLFFCGLSFQYAFSSMVLPDVGRDAAYVVKKIAPRAQTKERAAA